MMSITDSEHKREDSLGVNKSSTSDDSLESDTDDPEDNFPYPSSANPSEVTDFYALFAFPPGKKSKDVSEKSFGKWMIFRPFNTIDEIWHKVRIEIESGGLTESALGGSCTTLCYNPAMGGPGPCTNSVIQVHTTEENAESVGYVLISFAQHDIRYKTEEASARREYSWTGESRSVCHQTLYWNNGNPSFKLKGQKSFNPNRLKIKDEWHLNHVTAPEAVMSNSTVYGRWVIEEMYINLTELWYVLKERIEGGEMGPVEMVCPPKLDWKDPCENPVLLVYTARSNIEKVGLTLAIIVEKDIRYELSKRSHRQLLNRPVYNHHISWNDGEPVYTMSLIRNFRGN